MIDFGVLVEYSWTKFKNRYNRWVSSTGGYRKAYRSSSVRVGDEPSWESFSHAREQFFDTGWELNLQFPFFKTGNHLLAGGVVLFQNYKYTWTKKYFGYSSERGNNTVFNTTNKRISYKEELWFNSSFSLFYKYKSYFFRLVFIEPLVYARGTGTRVTDSSGKTLYSKKSKMERTVMEGGTVSRQPAGGESQRLVFSFGYYF